MLKKILLIIGILLVGLFAYIGVVWVKDVWPVNDTSLKDEQIGKLAIGMDESQIKHYYPGFEIVSEDDVTLYYFDDETGFIVRADAKTNKIVCMELREKIDGQKFTTGKGIGLGSSLADIKREYGTDYRKKNTEMYGDVIEFQDSKTNQKIGFGINATNDSVTVVVLYNYDVYKFPY
ncbi:hypothetical protein PWEIH_07291 [Listeria weihenstephanensis FSL R9-0317]|uniref:Uncharacterized protein n=1 Tax=Listeria weihenstephanensis TaxID=1006155 RepID=A0A1S7FXS6_9LIST|nr:hypothetical protein [Listeria weihenstephanensis]AQY52200.1 hypothetical protein UE46_14995 [Listeria weihenstephanensis]EUJ39489.1 hypothetical protein PWEIH_07291 [Listeria weihenstephanensis FSL R9-0317]